ncbi:MAG: hypothetical protein F6K52_29915 [Moorea sp. SIO3H5]|nr:hypothetical protein [Moorena sp. SIO3H5]
MRSLFLRALLNNGMILRVFWNGHLAWNWHLASFMVIVELASCQFPAYCGTGILPVSWLLWNWHLASFLLIFERASCQFDGYFRAGILPVSCLFSSGQDAHSTLIHSKTDATPNFFLFPIP